MRLFGTFTLSDAKEYQKKLALKLKSIMNKANYP